ncbi:hypothetical protein [Microbacterium sp. 18062]|uniref:hypothetical protein n=1 Tax=Microbacterium sp. 18062 TaxID=2681410 RepID=UPI00135AD2D9|nr:hypothetical protein [Microbacterium sp. 18062]
MADARILSTDDDLVDALAPLLGQAIRRQLWLFFLDENDGITDPIMPCDDFPADPYEPIQTVDIGAQGFAHVMAERVRHLQSEFDLATLMIVWERVGSRRFAGKDLARARAMAESCATVGVPLRAQLLLHDDGLRLITPDDIGELTIRRRSA